MSERKKLVDFLMKETRQSAPKCKKAQFWSQEAQHVRYTKDWRLVAKYAMYAAWWAGHEAGKNGGGV